jgi:large subunit ribosomal protein L5
MQIPVLKKIVINQGLGMLLLIRKLLMLLSVNYYYYRSESCCYISKKDISNFKLRKKMPIGVMVTLRREQMYEFLEKTCSYCFASYP